MYEFYNRVGHQLEDMLISCVYRGEECGPANFTTIMTRYGRCYTGWGI